MRLSVVLSLLLCWLEVVRISALPVDPPLAGKDKKYPVSGISQELLNGANAVIRLDQQTFEVQDINSGTHIRKYAVTILNEQAQKYGFFVNSYYGKSGLVQFNGTVFNALGVEIDKIKKSDLEDRSYFDGFSVYSDSRYESVDYTHHQYPYTIEYEFTEKYDGLMFYPNWRPQWATKLAVERAEYQVVVPDNMGLRYKEINLSKDSEIETREGLRYHSWTVDNLTALATDGVGLNWRDLAPKVIIGPNEFEFESYAGNMSSWESFGQWQLLVNQDLGGVSQETEGTIKALVSDVKDRKDKVRKIYGYLQENTRYVSVQLGIGGWRPFAPSYVEQNGFGDCKALSFYTKSMLKVVGIESLYTLVNAGREKEKIHTDFPSDQFNHVFLCVPLESDTVWLECTSQINPFGYLGTFTSDRPVLLITDDGGKLVRTPALTKEQNQKSTTAKVVIDQVGNASAHLSTIYKGYFSEKINQVVLSMGLEDQKKWLYKNLDLPSFQIRKLTFEASGEESPQITQDLDIVVRKKASVSGKRLFLQPSLLNQVTYVPNKMEERKTDIVINYNMVWSDTIEYVLPEQFHPEYMPDAVNIKSAFGNYSVDVIQDTGTIEYIRHFELDKGEYGPELYGEYRKFFEQIVKADKMKIVLKNAT